MPSYVTLLADTVERPEEIDEKRAEAAKERAEEKLRQKQSISEYYHTQAALSKALARQYSERAVLTREYKLVTFSRIENVVAGKYFKLENE